MKHFCIIILLIFPLSIIAQEVDWVKSFGTKGNDVGYGISTDDNANQYLVGTFSDTLKFGNEEFVGEASNNALLIKSDVNGDYQWCKTFISGNNQSYLKAVDAGANNVFIAGKFKDTLLVNNQEYYSEVTGKYMPFIVKYTEDGAFEWVKVIKTSGSSEIFKLKVTNESFYVAGSFSDTLFIGEEKIFTVDENSSVSKTHGFVASFDLDGNFNWLTYFDGTSGKCTGLDVDKENNIYAACDNSGAMLVYRAGFDGYEVLAASAGSFDAYLIKLNGVDGSLLWGNRIGGVESDRPSNVSVDTSGNAFIGGIVKGDVSSSILFDSMDGNGETFNGNGKYDIFVAKYSKDGIYDWAKVYGTEENEGVYPGDIVCTEKGSVLVSAYFKDPSLSIESDVFECSEGWTGSESVLLKFTSQGVYQYGFQADLGTSEGKHLTYVYDMDLSLGDTLIMTGMYKGSGLFLNAELGMSKGESLDIYAAMFIDPDEIHEIVGMEEILPQQSFVSVFPNPSNGLVNIVSDISVCKISAVNVYDMTGRLIESYEGDVKHIQIQQSGMYLMKIVTNKGVVLKKCIIN